MEPDRTDAPRVERRRSDVVVLCVAVIVLLLSTIALGPVERVPDQEAEVFRAINDLPDWIAWLVRPVMQLGVFWAGPLVALVLVVWGRRTAGATVLISTVGAYLLVRASKQMIGRDRPVELIQNLHLRDAAEGLGFPSGHSAVAMALVLALIPYLAWRWRYALLAVPLIVGFARVYVGAHLPLDVVAGWAIGAAAASLTHLAFGVPIHSANRRATVPHRRRRVRSA